MNFLKTTAPLAIFLALFAGAQANAQEILYGATGGVNPGSLYTIDPSTGAATLVGPLVDNSANLYSVTGLAFDSATGVLYGSTSSQSPSGPAQLVTINPFSGLVTVVGSFAAGTTMGDLTFNSVNNTLYGTGATNADLYTINLGTGAATSLGSSGIGGPIGVGVAARADGTTYGTPNGADGDLVTYNLANGATTVMQSLTGAPYGSVGSISALAFNISGILYGADINRGDVARGASLVTIDLNSGAVSDIGLTVANLDAIAFSVPEPSTWFAALLAAASLFFLRFRRKKTAAPARS